MPDELPYVGDALAPYTDDDARDPTPDESAGYAKLRASVPFPVAPDERGLGGIVPESSAATSALASGKRFAGSFSSIIMIARARSTGTSARRCSMGMGRSEMCLTRIAGVLEAMNGGSPTNI